MSAVRKEEPQVIVLEALPQESEDDVKVAEVVMEEAIETNDNNPQNKKRRIRKKL